jgi:hypothetical protein
MFISLRLILSVLLMSSMIESMDRPVAQRREMPIKNVSVVAFYPTEQNLADAAELGFPTGANVPFINVRFIHKSDYIVLNSSPESTRRLLHLPCTALAERNGLIPLPSGDLLTMNNKEEEFSILSAIKNLALIKTGKNHKCNRLCYR